MRIYHVSKWSGTGQMFGIGFGFGIKDKQGREAKFMMILKIGSRLQLNHDQDKNTVSLGLNTFPTLHFVKNLL